LIEGAHPGGLFGCHDRFPCVVGNQHQHQNTIACIRVAFPTMRLIFCSYST